MQIAPNTGRMVKVEILRQDTQGGNSYWQNSKCLTVMV